MIFSCGAQADLSALYWVTHEFGERLLCIAGEMTQDKTTEGRMLRAERWRSLLDSIIGLSYMSQHT